MGLSRRLGAAARAFLNPALRQPRPIPPPEPTRIVVDKLLAGRNVLVTGAGANIGRSIALEMLAQGANVYCTEIDPERQERLESDLSEGPGNAKVYRSDITRAADTDAMLADLSTRGVTVDLLVNNVGIVVEDLAASFDTNVVGPAFLTDRVSRAMIARGLKGSIVFLSSIHQGTVFTRSPAYAPTKAAVALLVQQFAVQLAPHVIRVNGVAPGVIHADQEGQVVPYGYVPLEGTSIPPQYVARAVTYLASDYYSRFTTGTMLKIDAGLSLFNFHCAADAGLSL
jgi:NAD(P)-dependent dehydrogenase (short-subunit alcohol dehydrogenase family)